MSHVFISYSRNDGNDAATTLETTLKKEDFRVWRDLRNLNAAQDFTADIEKGIEAASHVVVCLTPDTKRDNSFVRREVQYAQAVNKPVIPLRFADVVPHVSIINNEWVDYFRDSMTAVKRLFDILRDPSVANHKGDQPDDPFRSYVQYLYKRVVAYLDQSVIRMIDLSTEIAPDAVAKQPKHTDMFDLLFSPHDPKDEAPTDFSNFREVFQYYEGRVLLLGEPGAGKTITLLALARDVAAARLDDSSKPLPLFGIIPSWDVYKQPRFADWLSGSYKDLNADAVSTEIDKGNTVLLLDGLDELGSNHLIDPKTPESETFDPRPRLMAAIPENNHVLVTCRVQDYADIGEKIVLKGAVTLQPLENSQMATYLNDQPELLKLVQLDEKLQDWLGTPLLLSFFAFAYKDMSIEERQQLLELDNAADLSEKIFETYVRRRYEHEKKKSITDIKYSLDEIYSILTRMMKAAEKEDAERIIDGPIITIEEKSFWLRANATIPDADTAWDFVKALEQLDILIARDKFTFSFVHSLLCEHCVTHSLRKSMRDDPSNDHAETDLEGVLMDLGYVMWALGKLDRALEIYDQVIDSWPDYAWAWARKGRTLRLLKRYDDSLICYNHALEFQPNYAWAWNGKGIVLQRMGRLDEALTCFETATTINPNNVWNWYNRADVLQSRERYKEGASLLEQGLQIDPTHPNSWAKLGQIYRLLGRYDDSVKAYEKGIKLEPTYAWAYNGCGLTLKILGRKEDALMYFKQASRYNDSEVWHWYNMADILVELGQYEEAIQPMQQATRTDPNHTFSWAKLGQVMRHLQRYDEALEAYNRAVKLEPDSSFAINGKGIVLERLGRYEESLTCYERAAELEPDDVWHWCNQGHVLVLMGHHEEALVALDKATDIDPKHAKSWNDKGLCFTALDRWDEAVECYKNAIDCDPNNIWFWHNYGEALIKQENYQEAEKILQQAIAIDANHQPSIEKLKDIRDKLEE
jgi:tetratricopeptide (TPR) repeat protein